MNNAQLEELVLRARKRMWEQKKSPEPPTRTGALIEALRRYLGESTGSAVFRTTTGREIGTALPRAAKTRRVRRKNITLTEIGEMRKEYMTMRGENKGPRLATKYHCSVDLVRRVLAGRHPLLAGTNVPSLIRARRPRGPQNGEVMTREVYANP